ncbi:hypothetical protein B0H11DRAFT_1914755 [Mycena galericulata]|nr:hypothetical protein B0H11DRAFT_1914755 [Mycena galericulata]
MHVKFGPFGKGAGTCQKQRRYARLHRGMRSQSATRMDNGARNILKAVEIYTRAMSEYFTSAGDPASTLAIRRPTERGLPHRRDENMPRVKRTRPGEGSTNLRRQPEHSAADGDSSTTDSLVGDRFPNSSGCGRSLETIEIPTRSSLTFCPHGDYDRDMMWSRELYIFLEPGKTMEWRNWSELSWMFMEIRVENTIAIGLTASAATFGAEDWNEQKDLGRDKLWTGEMVCYVELWRKKKTTQRGTDPPVANVIHGCKEFGGVVRSSIANDWRSQPRIVEVPRQKNAQAESWVEMPAEIRADFRERGICTEMLNDI